MSSKTPRHKLQYIFGAMAASFCPTIILSFLEPAKCKDVVKVKGLSDQLLVFQHPSILQGCNASARIWPLHRHIQYFTWTYALCLPIINVLKRRSAPMLGFASTGKMPVMKALATVVFPTLKQQNYCSVHLISLDMHDRHLSKPQSKCPRKMGQRGPNTVARLHSMFRA